MVAVANDPESILVVTVGDDTSRFSGADAPVRVGRNPDVDVRLGDPSVSRVHLVIEYTAGIWRLHDQSSQGTYRRDGNRVETVDIAEPVELCLGRADGPSIGLAAEARPEPGGATMSLGASDLASTATIDDTALRLELDGVELAFPAQGVVRLGRSPDNGVVLGEQHSLVSRHHMAFEWDDGRWWMTDVGSARGTFVDGRKITERQPAEGAFHVLLGDKTAGTRIRVTTAGTHRTPRRLGPLLAGAALAVAVLASIAAVVLAGGGGDSDAANSSAQQEAAREATVLVELLDADLQRLGFKGSGVLVSTDGLILTNAHVAYPTTHSERIGLTSAFPDAPRFAIGFATEDGGEVNRFYVAEPVALHPFHDAALLQIVADGNNDPDFNLPFDPLPIGSTDDLKAGDLVDQLGFPAVAGTLRVSVTTRNFQSFAPCPGTAGDDCLTDLDDGWLNLSGQPLGGGSSGGPIVRDGQVVGINQGAVFQEGRAVEQNRAVPIDLIAAELLD